MDIEWYPDNRPPLTKETATVNGEVFPLILGKPSEEGHPRPAFRMNRVVRDLLDAVSAGKQYNLNDIWMRAGSGNYCKEEMLEFYRLIGYTFSGYCEIFEHEDLTCTLECDKCGCWSTVHPSSRCKKFVKEAKEAKA
jgi:hypothetical protein